METFKSFLSECGVDSVDALILFLNNLPDNPEAMIHMSGIERVMKQIEIVFDESDNNIWRKDDRQPQKTID